MATKITVGVLALQGAFHEHVVLLHQASTHLASVPAVDWAFVEVRTPEQLLQCEGLIIPGGESTTVSLVANRSNLLDPLRAFVKVHRKPTWGTCAGLILLAESANRTKKGGQELIGGLDVRVNRNYFGRQTESFEAALNLPFLKDNGGATELVPFNGIFIRAPVVEKVLPTVPGEQTEEGARDGTVIAPARKSLIGARAHKPVEIMAILPGRGRALTGKMVAVDEEAGDIVAVRQGNVFGTSFHPELTKDPRIHIWWLERVRKDVLEQKENL
ncbi:hypothetical protein MMC07_007151 [Pseudocyphellaria aurata]|nr:hypothetical protein [Pseudocyphellaria aurata]